MKKYIYPIVFSVIPVILRFFADLFGGVITISLETLVLIVILIAIIIYGWLIVVLPVYCVKYSKVILNEKSRVIFLLYNSLLILVSHIFIFPINLKAAATNISLFIIWVLAWNIIPLACRLVSREKEEKRTESENEDNATKMLISD